MKPNDHIREIPNHITHRVAVTEISGFQEFSVSLVKFLKMVRRRRPELVDTLEYENLNRSAEKFIKNYKDMRDA